MELNARVDETRAVSRQLACNWGDIMSPKGADRIANSVDPDQSAL